jgi:hypothetical protein
MTVYGSLPRQDVYSQASSARGFVHGLLTFMLVMLRMWQVNAVNPREREY